MNLQYTIAFPALLLLIAMVTQAAWWYSARNAALAAAQEGVRAARVRDGSPGAGQETARRFAREVADGQLRSVSVSVNASAESVAVRVTGEVWSFVPGLNMRVSQVARAPRERFTTPERG